jgi:hypothetical protein
MYCHDEGGTPDEFDAAIDRESLTHVAFKQDETQPNR